MNFKLYALVALAVAAAVPCRSAVSAVTVQDPAAAERWQAFTDPEVPLTWCWDEATSAKVVCRRAGAGETVSEIERAGSELIGSFTVSVTPEDSALGNECLFDVELQLYKGKEFLRRETARLAYLPGGSSGGMTVRKVDSLDWRSVKGPWVFAHPGGELPVVKVAFADGVVRSRNLSAVGGFDAILPATDVGSRSGPFAMSVSVGGEDLLSADLLRCIPGLFFILR